MAVDWDAQLTKQRLLPNKGVEYSGIQIQTAVTAYLKSKQLLLFVFVLHVAPLGIDWRANEALTVMWQPCVNGIR